MSHPFLVEQLVRDRQEELRVLARVTQVRRPPSTHRWRQAAARGLVAVGVTVGLPRERRRRAMADALALLDRGAPTEPARAPAC